MTAPTPRITPRASWFTETAAMVITNATSPPNTSASLCHSLDRRRLTIQANPTGTMSRLA